MNNYVSQKENVLNLLMICGYHVVFFSSSYIIIQSLELIFSLPLFILISLIHQKFLAEFLHEGSHYCTHRNKAINDFISNYLVGLFFFVSINNYRKKHFQHHDFKKFFSPKDPETGPLKVYTKKGFWKNVFFDLIGINGLLFLLNYTNLEASPRSNTPKGKFKFDNSFFIITIIQIIVFGISIIYNYYIFYLTYFLVAGTLYGLQVRLKVTCQHIFLEKNKKIQYNRTTSRTIKGGILEKLFFTSDVSAYHALHHDYPMYPFRKCKKIFLQKSIPQDKNIFSTTRSDIIFNYYKSLL